MASFMFTLFLSLAIFMFFGGIVSAVILLNESSRKKHRLAVIRGAQGAGENVKRKDDQDQRRSDLSKKLQETNQDNPKKKGNTLHELIMQAGMTVTVKGFWIRSIIFAGVVTFVCHLIGLSLFVKGMVFITAFLGLPKLFLKMKAANRQKKFLEDFADALESMMRLLKAGMPVSEAIKMAAREYPGPIGEEMERIYEQQKIGVPLPEAVLEGAKRMPLTEMQMFATAIAIQTQTGSSLSEVLQNLASVIRSRFKLKRKVKALSSEATASAGIIGALPVVVAGGMYFINREYIEVLFIDPTGKMLLAGAVIWMCVGVFVMRQMINFKV